jgi:hypothetical protein
MEAGQFNPAVASKHYTGRVVQSDRELADAIGALVTGAVDSNDQVGEHVSEFSLSFETPNERTVE